MPEVLEQPGLIIRVPKRLYKILCAKVLQSTLESPTWSLLRPVLCTESKRCHCIQTFLACEHSRSPGSIRFLPNITRNHLWFERFVSTTANFRCFRFNMKFVPAHLELDDARPISSTIFEMFGAKRSARGSPLTTNGPLKPVGVDIRCANEF